METTPRLGNTPEKNPLRSGNFALTSRFRIYANEFSNFSSLPSAVQMDRVVTTAVTPVGLRPPSVTAPANDFPHLDCRATSILIAALQACLE